MAGEFTGLLQDGQMGKVQAALINICKKSFEDDKSRETQAEIRRRLNLLLDGFKMLRGDPKYKWGIERILDDLPRYLRCKLDGAPYEPDTRTIWMPSDGSAAHLLR